MIHFMLILSRSWCTWFTQCERFRDDSQNHTFSVLDDSLHTNPYGKATKATSWWRTIYSMWTLSRRLPKQHFLV